MLNISKKSKRSVDRVLDTAITFFGPGGIGLDLVEQSDSHLFFRGGGGFVDVTVQPEGKYTDVNVQTREWEYQVKEFLRKV
ncbi:MAG: hypothetical protein ACETWR_08265 [Anaerolineae bacterium]